MSTTLTSVSKNGSYVASVKSPQAFSKICPDVDKDTRVVIKRLDDIHWEASIKGNRIQFRCSNVGYSQKTGSGFVFARQCGACPGRLATTTGIMGSATGDMARANRAVIFDLNQATVKPVFYPFLNQMARQLKSHPDTVLELQGHTCALGTEVYNEKLSQKRANAVRRYLMEKGINPDRIETRAFGDAMPAASNSTPTGRIQNRRVEFQLKQVKASPRQPSSPI
ncbi:MAG: OmpA family protein [Thermodesulfobacteriota bacterium]|nr:OmpA family protein [Thermodesulfobacteriota bacterium]